MRALSPTFFGVSMKNDGGSFSIFAILFFSLSLCFGVLSCGSSSPPATALVQVKVSGVGAGTVTSSIGGINCSKTGGGTCIATLDVGSAVTLNANPGQGFFFNGWKGGACSGAGACVITLNSDVNVSASFVNVVFVSNRALDG